jgi:hypothetical protein
MSVRRRTSTASARSEIRKILVNEQEHQIDLATALGKDVVDVTSPEDRA